MKDATGRRINPWTAEAVAKLTSLWAEGKSTSQIAARLGNGITRNAVIGKLHRIGLKGQKGLPGVPIKPAKADRPVRPEIARPVASPSPSTVPEPPEPITLAPAEPVAFRDLRECQCRYIVGAVSGADTIYCGAMRQFPSPYCEPHRALVRGPGTPGERRAVPNFESKSIRTGSYR